MDSCLLQPVPDTVDASRRHAEHGSDCENGAMGPPTVKKTELYLTP